ncbi:MAG: NfeD family protein [Planctomycetaceae bacterium]
MENSHLAILLLIVCLCLLVAELFIPSGGMILVTAGVCLVASVWFAWKAWYSGSPQNLVAWWSYVGAVVIAIPAVIGAILYVFPRTTMGKRILLDAPSLEEVTAHAEEAERMQRLIGERGQTVTLLNPGGIVLVAGERHHCESQGLLIEAREDVEVVGVSGNRLIVRRFSREPESDVVAGPPTPEAEKPGEDEPLDFDLPQG